MKYLRPVLYFFAFTSLPYSQDSNNSSSICWHAEPLPRCKYIIVTDFGTYYTPLPTGSSDFRISADWGVLYNINDRESYGLSLYASGDNEFNFGPEFRYRRWLDNGQSIDLGIGFPLLGQSSLNDGSFSPHALIKWNPVHWFGITVRPELRRKGDPLANLVFVTFPPQPKEPRPYRFHVAAGIEFGWIPGVTLAGISGVLLGLFALSLSGN